MDICLPHSSCGYQNVRMYGAPQMTALEGGREELEYGDTCCVAGGCHHRWNATPDEHRGCDPDAGPHEMHAQVVAMLANAGRSEEDGDGQAVLGRVQAHGVLDVHEHRVAQVRPVQLGDNVHEEQEQRQAPVDLPPHLALLLGCHERVEPVEDVDVGIADVSAQLGLELVGALLCGGGRFCMDSFHLLCVGL